MKITVEVQFEIKQCVYLTTDITKAMRIVTGILFNDSTVRYQVSLMEKSDYYYEFELQAFEIVTKKLGFGAA